MQREKLNGRIHLDIYYNAVKTHFFTNSSKVPCSALDNLSEGRNDNINVNFFLNLHMTSIYVLERPLNNLLQHFGPSLFEYEN